MPVPQQLLHRLLRGKISIPVRWLLANVLEGPIYDDPTRWRSNRRCP